MPLPTKDNPQSAEDRNRLWRLSSMGFTLATEVAAGALIGWLADWVFGFEKTFIIVGALGGVIFGLTGFIRAALAENRRAERDRRQS
ncbi:MAG: AtpZ/AtpI family protein [Phycisphaerales bacterium]|nr:AtpZ/AtpI family protein [Phycisphaerales bacterium]